MLKLLAVQVQKECKEYIMRCLKPGMMYYLCNDYEITQSGNGIWQVNKRRNTKTLSDSFYQIHADSGMRINVSAIVGENGSGKSSIVELILRMINNCAIHYGIRAESCMLEYVEGVYARLFYMDGDNVYCLSMEGGEETVKITVIASIENEELRPKRLELTSSDLQNHFFYTLVSNYSHYAYNTHDFRKEWQKQSDEDTCWLKWLFHKNDGYQTPITLHPFRDKGTVSIEREKNLSNQRLLYFFINYAKQNQKEGVFDYINGKKPKYLNLQEVKSSKLQQVTLLRYFDDNKNKDKAMKVLRSRLYERAMKEQTDKIAAERRTQVGSGDRSEKIRTYNYPQNRVTDHRIGLTLYSLDSFLDGDIGGMVDALIAADTAEKLRTGDDTE